MEKMAEVDFGDAELFDQLDDFTPVPTHIRFPDRDDADTVEDDDDEKCRLRSRLDECDYCIEKLTEENKALRRKLTILTRPSGITIEDVNIDGPIAQIIYSNNAITKQCRQEIEDCLCGIILRHQKEANRNRHSASSHLKPQPSSFAVDEDPQKLASTSVRTTTEPFKVVGSALYFSSFSVDKLGQPLFNDNPQHTDGWEVPTYQQVFNLVVGTDGQEIEVKDKRPKSMCFNCGSSAHQMRDCPKPKDMAAINERRKEFTQSQTGLGNHRYHADEVEERFSKYKPGVLSKELLSALGLDGNTLPPLIYRMRQLGYPPGWLKEAEMENSGLTLYDGSVSNVSSMTSTQNVSYDVSKLVDFPGFNVPPPHKVKDEFMRYSSVPMQSNHLKHNFAAYLSTHFASPDSPSRKRPNESDSSQHLRKRPRSCHDSNSDMDIESDPGTLHHTPRHGDCFSSPPPLPHGTPPDTPTPPPLPKSTPPPTPTKGSMATRGAHWVVVDEATEGREDELTLEELEEQQRLIWAALQNADSSSEPEMPAVGTPPIASPSKSTPVRGDSEMESLKEAGGCQNENEMFPRQVCPQNGTPSPAGHQDGGTPSPAVMKFTKDNVPPAKYEEDSPQSPPAMKFTKDNVPPAKYEEDSPQSPPAIKFTKDNVPPTKYGDDSPHSPCALKSHMDSPKKSQNESPALKSQEDSPQSPGASKYVKDSPQSPNPESQDVNGASLKAVAPRVSAVPHRSRFAEGIVPFEDTPEYTEVAEATGTYLRIRDLLKSSPRNLAKKKME
ncbi:zinc finger CCHC domain-containing protein 8 [Hippocampus comes]|uniref:Zinc finger CCHC domain-containing protein 8 n=1 Tax=Hippocampus comes TaxID=109280 RepID=A0A3Q2YCU5_HIPCM|nr:PREDICTED: zinc finger CCHC domain-containing protein 8 [Hippocampus comes]